MAAQATREMNPSGARSRGRKSEGALSKRSKAAASLRSSATSANAGRIDTICLEAPDAGTKPATATISGA